MFTRLFLVLYVIVVLTYAAIVQASPNPPRHEGVFPEKWETTEVPLPVF